jgi:hypothetical protein
MLERHEFTGDFNMLFFELGEAHRFIIELFSITIRGNFQSPTTLTKPRIRVELVSDIHAFGAVVLVNWIDFVSSGVIRAPHSDIPLPVTSAESLNLSSGDGVPAAT